MTEVDREYVDRMVDILRTEACKNIDTHMQIHEREREAVTLNREVINTRLVQMNEFREQITSERGTYIPRSEYSLAHQNLSDLVERSIALERQRASAEATAIRATAEATKEKLTEMVAQREALSVTVAQHGAVLENVAKAVQASTSTQDRLKGLLPAIGIFVSLITMLLLIFHVMGLY